MKAFREACRARMIWTEQHLVFKGVGLALLQDETDLGYEFTNVRIRVCTMLRLIETEPAKSQWA